MFINDNDVGIDWKRRELRERADVPTVTDSGGGGGGCCEVHE